MSGVEYGVRLCRSTAPLLPDNKNPCFCAPVYLSRSQKVLSCLSCSSPTAASLPPAPLLRTSSLTNSSNSILRRHPYTMSSPPPVACQTTISPVFAILQSILLDKSIFGEGVGVRTWLDKKGRRRDCALSALNNSRKYRLMGEE
jgi:hypothetical protein